MNIYYTYAYLREDKTPLYIGKGTGRRAWRPHIRNGKVWLNPGDHEILILKTDLTKQEAEDHERYLISLYGRKDLGTGILHNLTYGGEYPICIQKQKISDGSKGRSYTEEQKRKRSQDQTGKRWWNNGLTDKFCVNQPGPEWTRGRVKGPGRTWFP